MIGVYLYNRAWRFGAASVEVPPAATADAFEYRTDRSRSVRGASAPALADPLDRRRPPALL